MPPGSEVTYQFRDHGAAACELNIELRRTDGKQQLLYAPCVLRDAYTPLPLSLSPAARDPPPLTYRQEEILSSDMVLAFFVQIQMHNILVLIF